MKKTAIVIPARYNSSRLQGKPLILVGGKPVLQWTFEKAQKSKYADLVIIATDNQEIFDCARSFGANVMMTDANHQSGSDRICEVAKTLDGYGIIVNLQGDEPTIDPVSIDEAIYVLQKDDSISMSTLIRVITDEDELNDPNVVKCVIDDQNFAMYFSRSKIPYTRNPVSGNFYGHIGIYAYRKQALLDMNSMPQSTLELTESLEQLRALQAGMRIKCCKTDFKPIGIDTAEDVERFKKFLSSK